MALQNDTILQRVPALDVHVNTDNSLKIRYGAKKLHCGEHGLAVLDAFYHPISLNMALEKLQGRVVGALDWMMLTSTIIELYEQGILQEPGKAEVKLTAAGYRYDSCRIHTIMLNDSARTSAYLKAIPQIIQSGDVVLEIGTGTGVLAVAAAKAGARHVYTIEAGSMDKVAQAVFEANGVADRITLLKGWSNEVSLPEKADVLLGELVGSSGFNENLLEFTLDARRRLLKPDKRLIPDRLRLYGIAVTIPETWLSENFFTPAVVQKWQACYGIDFSPLTKLMPKNFSAGYVSAEIAKPWPHLSAPILLAEVDLVTIESPVLENSGEFSITTDGLLNAIIIYFELSLSPTVGLSTHPQISGPPSHWETQVFMIENRQVRQGMRLAFSYARGNIRGDSSLTLAPIT